MAPLQGCLTGQEARRIEKEQSERAQQLRADHQYTYAAIINSAKNAELAATQDFKLSLRWA